MRRLATERSKELNVKRLKKGFGLAIASLAAVFALAACSSLSSSAGFNLGEKTFPQSYVYAMTASENPQTGYHAEYTLDNRGNAIEYTYPMNVIDGTTHKMEVTQEVDQNGWVVRQVREVDGSPDKSFDCSVERNDNGQVVKMFSTSNSNVTDETTYEYHANGMLKKRTTMQPSGAYEYEEFDEAGYRVEQLMADADGNVIGIRYEWRFDSKGSLVERLASPIGGASLNNGARFDWREIPEVAKPTFDADGNIVEYRDGDGTVVQRITWVKVDNPSEYVSIFNRLIR